MSNNIPVDYVAVFSSSTPGAVGDRARLKLIKADA